MYRRPAIQVIQEFQNAAAALSLPTLPACVVGPGYQIMDDANCGIYTGIQALFPYVGLFGGAVVDLTAEPTTDAEINVYKPVELALKDAYLVSLDNGGSPFSTGEINVPVIGQSKFYDATPSRFAGIDPAAVGAPNYYVDVIGPGIALATGTITAIAKAFKSTGSITCPALAAEILTGDSFTIYDGVLAHSPVIFEFVRGGAPAIPGALPVDIVADVTGSQAATTIRAALTAAKIALVLDITNGGIGANITLSNDHFGAAGNQTITDTVADLDFVVTGMSGGVDGILDGETVTIADGVGGHSPNVFEFDTGGGVTPGNVAVDISLAVTNVQVATALRLAIAARKAGGFLDITSSGSTAVTALSNDHGGVAGNIAITDTVADAGFVHVGMTGGAAGIDPADIGRKLVTLKVDDNTLKVANEWASTGNVTSINYRVLEFRASEIYPPSSFATKGIVPSSTGVTVGAGLTSYTDLAPKAVVEASIMLSWRALRPDLAGSLNAFTDVDSLKAIFGVDAIVPTNIGAYAVSLALQNTTTSVSFTGLSDDFFGNEELAFQSSLEYLESKDVYGLAILSHNAAVHQMSKTHVEGMSDPAQGRERTCFISRKLSSVAVVEPASGIGNMTGGSLISIPATNHRTFRGGLASAFITDHTQVGHFLEVVSYSVGGGALTAAQAANLTGVRHQIATVDSQNQVTLVNDPTDPGTGGAGGGITLTSIVYRITRDMTRDEEASLIAGYSTSFASRRVVHTWPDVLAVSVGGTATKVPGYFAGAVLSGMTAGLPSQAGFTHLSVTGFVGRENSDDRFTDTQLDVIAGGGTLIFTQPVPDAALSVRHQLTTDVSTIYYQEFSVTKNVDLVARFMRNLFSPYIGIYNITDSLLDILKTKGESGIDFLKKQRAPRVGAPLRSGSLSRIAESSTQPDSVEIDFTIGIPLPLNNLTITLYV